ncbi:MAG: NAD+ synthase [Candidatus Saccharibacteria bacterium]
MKVTIAQLNPIVGDIDGNKEKLRVLFEKSAQEGSDLLVVPELYLTGYPPRDLLDRAWFIEKCQQALLGLQKMSELHPETGLLVGMPTSNDRHTGKGLYNSAVLICGGQAVHSQHKTLLPIYDVFDEARYFDSAVEITTIPFKDEVLGISICEDAWNDPELWPKRRIYNLNPIEILAAKGASLLINISASPFHAGKEEQRFSLISNHARRHSLPFIYVNQVGGNDELIFDGRSIFTDMNGQPVLVCPAFSECIQTVETRQAGSPGTYKPQDKIGAVHDALVLGIRDYIKKSGFSQAVIGLSGGIDSAVTCCLAAEALGPENVLGISMPSPYSSNGSVDDSRVLAKNLGVEFRVIPISDLFDVYLQALEPYFAGQPVDVTEENIQARIRGNILMAFSNKFGHLVLSTGNKTELAVGYCTLYGDMSGGLSVLADVPKTMVYELARHINREREIIPQTIIDKAPSAELRPDQYDQQTLPPYPVLDQILHHYIEDELSVKQIVDLGFEEGTVRWVVCNVDHNEYKRKQAPLGLKVTTKAFGAGRRIPIAAKY